MPDDETPGGRPVPAEVSTDCVPQAERWSWWGEFSGRELMASTISSPYADRFHGAMQAIGTPEAQAAAVTVSPLTALRTAAHIRRDDPENYYLVLVRDGRVRIEQERGTACTEVGELALFSTSHPLACEFVDLGRHTEMTLLRMPRTDFPLRGGRADGLLGTTLDTSSGAGALLAGYLADLPHAVRTSGPAEAAKLAAIAADLAATAIAVQIDAEDRLPPESRNAALLARIRAFIDLHLADPDLDPAAIAAHHHISVRTLHSLFAAEPETVAASIRSRRLRRCHADLTDPASGHRTVAAIATRWGFRHPGDFSRAYRTAYGHSPTETRTRARSGRP
ncbi:helix-turn-helix domain-containing protein [Yinghuangia soli]|uniref:Helix-turn-helix domain-containing protein n=1 Tax=Yinghuangia soli TaxID=2908204 RepID=A0AA41U0M5_9ACTN|nr:helix-turn-helix domain-containing protein [Yinghuangia soli]MCF2526562.1 helix-turn-helix domain-containing protein [Yinghuangia soli]